jgi:hypothetical protein
MRNQLVVDLALAGPNIIPDPIPWGSRASSPTLFGSADEHPADLPSGIDCRLIRSWSDSDRTEVLSLERVKGFDIASDLWLRLRGR